MDILTLNSISAQTAVPSSETIHLKENIHLPYKAKLAKEEKRAEAD
jgi:hypothetical protein